MFNFLVEMRAVLLFMFTSLFREQYKIWRDDGDEWVYLGIPCLHMPMSPLLHDTNPVVGAYLDSKLDRGFYQYWLICTIIILALMSLTANWFICAILTFDWCDCIVLPMLFRHLGRPATQLTIRPTSRRCFMIAARRTLPWCNVIYVIQCMNKSNSTIQICNLLTRNL